MSWYCVLRYHSSILPKTIWSPISTPWHLLSISYPRAWWLLALVSVYQLLCLWNQSAEAFLAPEVPTWVSFQIAGSIIPDQPDCSRSLLVSLFTSLQLLCCFRDYFKGFQTPKLTYNQTCLLVCHCVFKVMSVVSRRCQWYCVFHARASKMWFLWQSVALLLLARSFKRIIWYLIYWIWKDYVSMCLFSCDYSIFLILVIIVGIGDG